MAVTDFLPRSLKFRMTAVVVVLVLAATAVVVSVALRQAERDMKAIIGGQQYALLAAAAGRIDDQIDARRTLLAALADTMPAAVRDDQRLMAAFIASQPTARAQFFNIVSYDSAGKALYSARDGTLSTVVSMAGKPYFDQTLALKRGMVSPPFKSRLSGQPIVLLTEPVFDQQGRVALVISGSIDLANSHFFDHLNERPQGRGGYVFIMTPEGMLLHHPDRGRLLQQAGDGASDAIGLALNGYEGWTEARDREGSAGIYAYARLKTTGWIIGARFPTAEAFAPMELMRRQTVLAAVFAVGAGAAARLAILALLRPLGSLRRHIAAIRSGRAGIDVLQGPRQRRDEIGELSAAFHELMAEREAAQARTRDSESLIRTILDRAPDAFISCDQGGIITEWNAQAEHTFGWRRDEAVGQDVARLIIPPDKRSGHWAGMARFAAFGKGAMLNQRVTLKACHRDGHLVPVELSLGALSHGGVQFVTAFLHDISKRLAHEEQIAAGEKRARMIADNMPALIAYIDRDLRYRFTNAHFRDLMAVDPKSVLGKTIPEVFGHDFYLRLKDHLDAVLRGERVQYEREGRETGRPLQLMAHMIPDFDADGGVAGFYLMTLDISARKNAELTQAASEQRLKLITDHLPVLISYLDQERRYQFINATFEQWFGRDPRGLIGRHVADGLSPEQYRVAAPQLDQAYGGRVVTYEVKSEARGRSRTLETTLVPEVRADGRTVGVYSLTHDTTRMKDIEERLTQLARIDALTGIANRRMFEETLHLAIGRAQRSGQAMALAYLDIDHFKVINDTLGHGAGDDVLKEFAARLVGNVRATDTVARLAGDEFVIIFEQLHHPDEAAHLAGKIIAAVRVDFVILGKPLRITTSVGVALLSGAAETPAELVARADTALYVAKRNGRDRHALA
ncbi:PAS domain S-box protein [Rugamonas sp.]|uniref:PAS domain S-box protein n=1 Tax=Rugamonas sp. TaxID=1926287 RepID=UPI0025FA447F|nr:PAS domain S-box protein [Rugamonas sp.]